MTRDETLEILAVVRLLWPHSNLGHNPVEVVGIWQSMLHDTDRRLVELAVREQAANGREHAPPVGVIVKAVAEREQDVPDWDEAQTEIRRAIASYRPPREDARTNPYAPPPADYWSHTVIAKFMEFAWDEWRLAPDSDRTFLAQQREAYKALRARAERAGSLRLVGAPRRRDLAKPDYLSLLPGGDAA